MAIGKLGYLAIAATAALWGQALTAQDSVPTERRTVPAPWWMRDPVIAATGSVHIYLPANRAAFEASFSQVERTAEDAMEAVSRRSAALDTRLQAIGANRVQFTRTFATRPLYRQYRDGEGNRVDNERADMIENYQVLSTVSIEVRDMAVIEQVYNLVAQASPNQIAPIRWSLQPDDAVISALAVAAMRDATSRARQGAEAAGARLGPVRIIDPSGSVCETQVLTGWRGHRPGEQSRDVSDTQDVIVTGSYVPAPPPPPPPPGSAALTLRPPLQQLADTACAIFSLQ